ncbi:unnamed protein product [Rotaria sordida]|uniref:GED domain-containing protein n=1 Tax=Rotaria sordida TaxID=392033 RepID=A0A815KND4_9BILA|nr:unnamed protein product [Rotaria sordida]CAF1622381.1 unnamed protein product [Rotaria sordida]
MTENQDDDELMFDAISNDDQAVQDMLISVFAYWKLLLKRFTDYAALSVRAGCVFDVCPSIKARLREVPQEQPDFIDFYLAEDSSVRTRRKQLQQTKERLEKVYAILGGGGVNLTSSSKDMVEDPMEIIDSSSMTLEQLEQE